MKSIFLFTVLVCAIAVSSVESTRNADDDALLLSSSTSEQYTGHSDFSDSSTTSNSTSSQPGAVQGTTPKHHLPAHIVPMIVGAIGATLLVAIILGVLKHKRDTAADGGDGENKSYEKIQDDVTAV